MIDEKEKRRKEKVGSYVKVYRSKLYSNNKKHDSFKVKDAERKKREKLMATCHSSINSYLYYPLKNGRGITSVKMLIVAGLG